MTIGSNPTVKTSANPNDIYNMTGRLRSNIDNLMRSDISENNKQLIMRFVNYCFAEGLSKSRTIRYIQNLKGLALILKKDFEQCTRENIQNAVAEIEMREYSEWTRQLFKVTLKKFYAWQKNCEHGEYPECVKWIRTTLKKNRLHAPEILTPMEIQRMAESTRNPRDRLFISLLFESGCRLSEIMTLTRNDVQFDEHGAVIFCHGKTGSRRVRIIACSEMLHQWIIQNDNDCIWTNREGDRVSHEYMRRMLVKIGKRVGITKRIYPHLFRHSRATQLATRLTEQQLKIFFGWSGDSRMASMYVHLSGADLDKSLIELSQL